MRRLAVGIGVGLVAAALLASQTGLAAQGKKLSPEEAALQKNAEAFVAAFNKGDAKTLAAFWTPDGDYLDQDGRRLKGRKAIEEAMRGFFAENKGAKLRINIDSVRLVTPDLAIEDGTTDVIPADGTPPSRTRYTIVHVKQSGQWLLASVREAPFVVPTHSEHLRELEWLIGGWADEEEKGEVAHALFSWTSNGNFILSSFSTSVKGIPIGEGTQWIGWDPNAKHIRSWTFESSGGFGEAVWTRDGNKWLIKSSSTLRDGNKVTATNIVTRLDTNTLSWQSTNRTMEGKALPDTKAVKMKRLK
ncbi:MAG: SgcJ/EcaC family oxidoreductase [Gemmataceae bacterium]|nr:SgcJ/EcaC family oxidoreductase [Gemmataceae bacterium]